jgi:hypothetical protein
VAIEFKCPCGQACSADVAQSGKMFTCPACGFQIKVPMPKRQAEDAAHQQAVGQMIDQVQGATGAAPRTRAGREDALKDLLGEDALTQIRAESHQLRRAIGETVGINVPDQPAPGAETKTPVAMPGDAGAAAGAAAPADVAGGGSSAGAGSAATGAAAGGRSALTRRLTSAASEVPVPKTWAPPPKGLARAAHHIAFKRIAWWVTLIVAAVCFGMTVWCYIPHPIDPGKLQFGADNPEVQKTRKIVADSKNAMWAVPRDATPIVRDDGTVAYKDEKGEEAPGLKIWKDKEHNGTYYAVPAGVEPTTYEKVRPNGDPVSITMKYVDSTGFERDAEVANLWIDMMENMQREDAYVASVAASSVETSYKYHHFGYAFLGVAIPLLALGLWLWRDVRTVRRETEGQDGGQAFDIPTATVEANPGPARDANRKG